MAITYAPSVNFGAKDSLPSNDPSKVIKGSEFSVEFTAIQTAFSLAAPTASPTFTGTVTIASVDINGGTIDGTVIGAATPAAGSFTTLTASDDVNFDSGTFFVDASANAVGIGTTSPGYKLSVSATGTISGEFRTSGAINALFLADAGTTAETLYIGTVGNDFRVVTGSNERMRIDSSGNVGIGVTPSAWGTNNPAIQIGGGNQSSFIGLNATAFGLNSYFDGTNWRYLQTGGAAALYSQNYAGGHSWRTAPSGTAGNAISFTQAMTLDASGNLLVGKTSSALGTAGVELAQGGTAGKVWMTRSGDNPLLINRLSTDGSLVDFYKDGTTVGSIGTDTSRFKVKSSSIALYLENESNKQLVWGNVSSVPYFYPQSDNDTNLGFPTQRFKDLYLSGGVYLGGTGAANLLDDYEEGTWTPVSGTNSTVNSIGSAFYTKVGRQVTVYAYITSLDIAAVSITLGGLPFTATFGYGPATVYYGTGAATVFAGNSYVEQLSTIINLTFSSTFTGAAVMISATYFV